MAIGRFAPRRPVRHWRHVIHANHEAKATQIFDQGRVAVLNGVTAPGISVTKAKALQF